MSSAANGGTRKPCHSAAHSARWSRTLRSRITSIWLNRFAFFYTRQFHYSAKLTQSLADALVALFVGQIHAAGICRNADVVCDQDQQRIGIGISAVLFNGCEFFLVRAPAEKVLYPAYEEDLKRGHQRWRTSAIENLS